MQTAEQKPCFCLATPQAVAQLRIWAAAVYTVSLQPVTTSDSSCGLSISEM